MAYEHQYEREYERDRDNMCFACGKDNPIGLKLRFEPDGEELVTRFMTRREFQGYPGILHGGIIGTILDDLMANLFIVRGIHAVTASIDISFRVPIPIGEMITGRARIVDDSGRIAETEGELYLPDGKVAVRARGRFAKLGKLKTE
ncbi:MAG TPA: PaaI family thioesterase [Firmicutes bacterium]|nr:PaaI family thioesterase [Bacillota bacterium]